MKYAYPPTSINNHGTGTSGTTMDTADHEVMSPPPLIHRPTFILVLFESACSMIAFSTMVSMEGYSNSGARQFTVAVCILAWLHTLFLAVCYINNRRYWADSRGVRARLYVI